MTRYYRNRIVQSHPHNTKSLVYNMFSVLHTVPGFLRCCSVLSGAIDRWLLFCKATEHSSQSFNQPCNKKYHTPSGVARVGVTRAVIAEPPKFVIYSK